MYQFHFKTSLTLKVKKNFSSFFSKQADFLNKLIRNKLTNERKRALIKLTNETNVHSEVKCSVEGVF